MARADVPTVAPGSDVLAGVSVVPQRVRGYDYRRAAFGDAWTDDNDAPGGRNGCDTRNDILNRDLVDKTYVSIKRCPDAVATALGIAGVIASFGLFYIGERVFHLSRDVIQTLMYLKLSVAGHLTIFATRTRRPFWSERPAGILLGAVLGTQLLATLIAATGVLMTPIGWGWALLVWCYAVAWFLVNDRVKLLTYRVLDR